MRFNPDCLTCVVFICKDREYDGSLKCTPIATGFLVSAHDRIYVITSQHVVTKTRRDVFNPIGNPDSIVVRFNTAQGVYDLPTSTVDWHVHETYDVAAYLLKEMPESVVATAVPNAMFVTEGFTIGKTPDGKMPNVLKVETGDDVHIVGLFVQESGNVQNLPIARFGKIARTPSEVHAPKFYGDRGTRNVCYLMECMSWGGLSGSPVFWNMPASFRMPVNDYPFTQNGSVLRLIGIVTGHVHGLEDSNPFLYGKNYDKFVSRLNSGISVVPPAHAIAQLLEYERVSEERQKVPALSSKLKELSLMPYRLTTAVYF